MNETEFLTPEGFKKLEDELEFLKTKRRSDVAQRLHEAMEEGETEENPEYEDAKNEQAFVEGRILTIETILGNAKLIEMKGPSNEVRLGSKLTITEVGTTDKEHYTLVGSAEADPKHGKISNESPMGKALLGRKLHEVVSVTTPSGLMKFKIVHISNK
ncbi:MAG: transcription elongation factor GreA [Thermoflexales bacterium]|jgi:transcription elongation factor GreA|nr:transcription elongation factor GreA [Thermoflexales bacterium]